MNSTFCPSCGVKHTYNYSKPKFCSSCGNSLGAVLQQPQKISKTRSEPEYYDEEDFDPENSDAQYVPNISRFQVDVENYSESASFSLGSLFGQAGDAPKSNRSRRVSSVDDFINNKTRRGE